MAYQDEVHGNLFEQVEKTMQILLTKYMVANISYKGIHRQEEYPIPEAALREAVLNAVVHKDYSSGNPIQISVYKHQLIIWNEGELPEDWTVKRLVMKHPSRPFNPDIANSFFRAGLIEAWDRGTIKILNECKIAGVKAPVFKYDLSGFVIHFKYSQQQSAITVPIPLSGTNVEQVLALIAENESVTISQLAANIAVTDRTIKRILKELQDDKRVIREGSRKSGKWRVVD